MISRLVTLTKSPAVTGNQGVITDGTYFYIVANGAIRKYSNKWKLVTSNTSAGAQVGVNHMGDGAYYAGNLYIAAEDYPAVLNQRIAIFNASDLSFVEYKDISAQAVEVSGLCIDAAQGTIFISNYNTGDKIYKYSLSDYSYLGAITLSTPVTAAQGITYKNGYFYIPSVTDNKVYEITSTGTVVDSKLVVLPTTNEIEGIDYTTDAMYVLDGTAQVVYKVGAPKRSAIINQQSSLRFSKTGYINTTYTLPSTGTISARVKITSLFNWNEIWDCSGNDNIWEAFVYSDGRLSAKTGTASAVAGGVAVKMLNEWHTVTHTWVASGLSTLYLDGEIVGAIPNVVSTSSGTTFSWAGGNAVNTRLDGFMCDGRVYEVELTPAQVKTLHLYGVDPAQPAIKHLMNDGSGTTVADSSGNGRDGTITNGTWSTDTPTKLRTASSNRVAVQDVKSSLRGASGTSVNTGITPSNTMFSIAFWLKPNPNVAGSERYWTTLTGGNGFYFIHDTADSKIYFSAVNGGVYTYGMEFGRQRFTPYKWSHYVVTVAQNNIRGYKDGELIFTQSTVNIPTSTMTARLIDAVTASNMSQYIIANGTYWTAQEVLDLYKSGKMPSGVTQYLPLQEGAGTTAYDSSGNGNNGTITSGTFTSDVPTKKRGVVGGNLVYNGDFSYIPPVNVATTTGSKFIDGTASGSTSPMFGWGNAFTAGSFAALFDTSEKKSGIASLKISTTATASSVQAMPQRVNDAANMRLSGIPCLPSTSYTGSFWAKTNVVSGAASSGAYFEFRGRDAAGTADGNPNTRVNIGSVTTDWTRYSITFTTQANTRYICPQPSIIGTDGAATLIMDAWFDDIQLRPTVIPTRGVVS